MASTIIMQCLNQSLEIMTEITADKTVLGKSIQESLQHFQNTVKLPLSGLSTNGHILLPDSFQDDLDIIKLALGASRLG